MTVCTLYSVNNLFITASSFSDVAGPKHCGRIITDMNGAFISGGIGRGERDSLLQSISVAQPRSVVLYSVIVVYSGKHSLNEQHDCRS